MDDFVQLPVFGYTSFQFRKKPQKSFTDRVKFIFMLPVKVKSFFTFTDKLPKILLLGLFYEYKYGSCNATYHGIAKRLFKVRICQHLCISNLTEKKR